MDIDVVLINFGGEARLRPGLLPGALVAHSALEMVEAVRTRLGTAGHIERLRILDEFSPAQPAWHPLLSTAQLTRLRALFAPGGHVEITTTGTARGLPTAPQLSVQGIGGGFQGFSGSSGPAAFDVRQLSALLQVPVTIS